MTPIITAFESSPDRGQGLARDMRVRWALEEVGQPYDVRLVSFTEMKEPAHRALHPFGQIPTYEDGDLALFKSGAIIFHIAEQRAGLLPNDAKARARAITHGCSQRSTRWSRRSSSANRPTIWVSTRGCPRRSCLSSRIASEGRLDDLSRRLGDADWLDGAFSAGDLMMVMVLRRSEGMGPV